MVCIMRADRQAARSRFEEMMAMAQIARQRDERRFEEMKLLAQQQQMRDEARWEEIRLQAKSVRDQILSLILTNRVGGEHTAAEKKN